MLRGGDYLCLGLVAPILAGMAATLTWLSGEIIVSVKGFVTLRDVIYHAFKRIASVFSETKNKLEIFQAAMLAVSNLPGMKWLEPFANPTKAFELLQKIFIAIRNHIIRVISLMSALWVAFRPPADVVTAGETIIEGQLFGVNKLKNKWEFLYQSLLVIFQEIYPTCFLVKMVEQAVL